MADAWRRRIDRAADLADASASTRPLLLSYRRMLELQRDCYASLCTSGEALTGSITLDLPIVLPAVTAMVRTAIASAPPEVAENSRQLGREAGAVDTMLLAGWRTRSDHSFLQKLALQPYAECLAALGKNPTGRDLEPQPRTCPFCGGLPQLAILENGGADEGLGRQLLCATCATRWRIGRVCCACCGEDDEKQLAYFRATELEHLRVDTCDACRGYVKTIDLTRLGLAEPLVDEVAGASLDLWAAERGYRKLELNLIGL